MFFRSVISVFLLSTWVFLLNTVCAAAPLMVEKNLFATDRKPPSPESLDTSSRPAKPSLALSNIQLDGVIIHSGGKKAVLRMKNLSSGSPGKKGSFVSPFLTVREGEMVSDYRVSKIEAKTISLEKEGQTFTISLFSENKVLSPTTPSVTSVQPQQPNAQTGGPQPEANPEGTPGQPGINAQNQPQVLPNRANAAANPGGGRNRNPNARLRGQDPAEQGVQDPAFEPDPNQPAETLDEE